MADQFTTVKKTRRHKSCLFSVHICAGTGDFCATFKDAGGNAANRSLKDSGKKRIPGNERACTTGRGVKKVCLFR